MPKRNFARRWRSSAASDFGCLCKKKEACGFHCSRNRLPNGLALLSEGLRIGVKRTLRYLGVTFNSGLIFGQHFALLGPKIRVASASLG